MFQFMIIDIKNKGNKYIYKILIVIKCYLTDKSKEIYEEGEELVKQKVFIFLKHLPK